MDQSLDVRNFQGIRRWPRYEIDLPVRIIALNGVLTTPVNGHGHEISRAGMALQASVAVEPGDMMQLQFPTSDPSRVLAIVRNRNGNRMGLEFLSQLPPDDETKHRTKFLSAAPPVRPITTGGAFARSCTPETLSARLQRKREEQKQVEKEIEVLKLAITLLAEDEKDLLLMPAGPGFDVRPWPLES